MPATAKQLEALRLGREKAHKSIEGNKRKSEKMRGEKNWNYGKDFSKETRAKLSIAGLGRTPPNKGRKWSEWMSEEGRHKSLSCLKSGVGETHWNWKGGVQKEHRPRDTQEYKLWRTTVFQRDRFTCVLCYKTSNEVQKEGYRIVADHIKGWKDYPEHRFDVENGRTLCEPCHYQTDNFGFRIMWSRIKNKQTIQ